MPAQSFSNQGRPANRRDGPLSLEEKTGTAPQKLFLLLRDPVTPKRAMENRIGLITSFCFTYERLYSLTIIDSSRLQREPLRSWLLVGVGRKFRLLATRRVSYEVN